jgi:hypothetical protein
MARAPILPFLFSAGRNAGIFLFALLLVCAGLNALLPSLYVAGLSEKLVWLQTHPGEIDTVFIGSSRVYHSFDPMLFDGETRRLGLETRSFNLGIDGMRPPESLYVLRQLLALRLPLRRVIFELVDIHPKINAANIGSARTVHWHDWRHTLLALRQLAASSDAWSDKAGQAGVHLGCFLARLSNLGRGPEWLGKALLASEKKRRLPQPWDGHLGFEPLANVELTGKRRADYESAVVYLREHPMDAKAPSPLLASALRELVASVRAAGAEPLFVISPTVLRNENFADLAVMKIDAPVLAFTDPRRHPAVFDLANHCDEQHLNASGAAEYTRALAEELASISR